MRSEQRDGYHGFFDLESQPSIASCPAEFSAIIGFFKFVQAEILLDPEELGAAFKRKGMSGIPEMHSAKKEKDNESGNFLRFVEEGFLG
jgi:hypothetical protein